MKFYQTFSIILNFVVILIVGAIKIIKTELRKVGDVFFSGKLNPGTLFVLEEITYFGYKTTLRQHIWNAAYKSVLKVLGSTLLTIRTMVS